MTCNDRWNFFSKIHKSLNCFFDFYSSSKTFNFLEIQYPKFGIHSDIAEMTPVRPVFKPERNTSILVLAKVSVRYTWRKGQSWYFLSYWRYFYFLKKKVAVSLLVSLKKQSFAVFYKRENFGFWKCKHADFVEPNDLANHILSKTRVKVLWEAYSNGLIIINYFITFL